MKFAPLSLALSATGVLGSWTSFKGTHPRNSSKPLNFGLVLYPNPAVLDVFGPFQFLNDVSWNYRINLAIIASDLRPITTQPLQTFVDQNDTVGSNFSQQILPTHTFKHPPKDLDVLFVPGGPGSMVLELDDAIAYIRHVYPSLQYIFSVCTGSTLLARAGVLDGKNATTNKSVWKWATATGPKTNWLPGRWVVDGNIWTTSGVAAGMDGMLAFIAHLFGEDYAVNEANGVEYEWHNNATWDPFATLYNVTAVPPRA